MGEPRAGRSSLLDAIAKVFEQEWGRLDEADFHRRELGNDVQVEVVLGDLGQALEQRFLDLIEFWDPGTASMIASQDDAGDLPPGVVPVLRLAYRGAWNSDDERADQVVYWPKTSDPANDDLRRVTVGDRRAFPFVRLVAGRPLSLGARGLLRSSLDEPASASLAAALQRLRDGVQDLAGQLADVDGLRRALEKVLTELRRYSGVSAPTEDMVRFLPDDGSMSGLLRTLSPVLDLEDGAGLLPLSRHGSTTTAQIATAEVLATVVDNHAVVLVDDFGDTLDSSAAQRLASLLRQQSGQVWLSTRRPEAARAFDTSELVRLTRRGARHGAGVYYGSNQTSRGARVAAREVQRQVLPAITARSLIIVEGPHDSAAYTTLAEELDAVGTPPPEAYGIRVIDAGSTEGGIDRVSVLSGAARSLGFRVVALTDYDRDELAAASRLESLRAAADAVVRLPNGFAVERALLAGVPDATVIAALGVVNQAYSLPLPPDWTSLASDGLAQAAMKALKSNSGVHSAFVRALAPTVPPLATKALEVSVDCARGERLDDFVQVDWSA